MRCLIRYQLRDEDKPARYEFSDSAPDLEKVITRLTEFLHPEVTYEFLPIQKDGADTVTQLRARIADARAFLEHYCGLKSLSYRLQRDDAPPSDAEWSGLLLVDGLQDWSDLPTAGSLAPRRVIPAGFTAFA
ncbi:hypothetical protein [Herbaspirillum sp. LeCh32-8]|uniref:hypothetical protein n=1 Tax=Herbaspirillum sp. LeCh32-8 TaxID=2821356 RepID=UPI001FD86B78|nr:hypothetical protein [Herbaspirillum sp. LeCh32-8]